MPYLSDAGPEGAREMLETVETDTVDSDTGEESNEIPGNYPAWVSNGHDQSREVDEMIDQNLWRPNMPLAVDKDGLVQYQPQEGTYQGQAGRIHDVRSCQEEIDSPGELRGGKGYSHLGKRGVQGVCKHHPGHSPRSHISDKRRSTPPVQDQQD